LGKIIWDKSKSYWERFEEQTWEFGNPMGTIRNMMGTREKIKKNLLPPLPPPPPSFTKRKILDPS
jgi:hypothetical protein